MEVKRLRERWKLRLYGMVEEHFLQKLRFVFWEWAVRKPFEQRD